MTGRLPEGHSRMFKHESHEESRSGDVDIDGRKGGNRAADLLSKSLEMARNLKSWIDAGKFLTEPVESIPSV